MVHLSKANSDIVHRVTDRMQFYQNNGKTANDT